jgi:transcriptional regulator with XRE-family HTH domain
MADEEDLSYGATVAKRRLSQRLAAMRARAGLSVGEAGDKLNWSRGRLQRIEGNQWRRPEPSYIRDLARIYGATSDEETELLSLAMHARTRLWWRAYEDVFGSDREFPGYENDAAAISTYMPLVLPGLLQVRAYTEAHMRAGSQPPQWRVRALEARLRRQQILSRPQTAPRLTAVITEAALAYRWGTTADHHDQVNHLITMSQWPDVEIRLLRFKDGPHPGMSSLINLFDFPDDDPILYLETDTATHEITGPAEVRAYKDVFTQITNAALGPDATCEYLEFIGRGISVTTRTREASLRG